MLVNGIGSSSSSKNLIDAYKDVRESEQDYLDSDNEQEREQRQVSKTRLGVILAACSYLL